MKASCQFGAAFLLIIVVLSTFPLSSVQADVHVITLFTVPQSTSRVNADLLLHSLHSLGSALVLIFFSTVVQRLAPPSSLSCEWRFCLWPRHPLPLRSNLCSSLCPADWQIATLVLLVAGAVATLAAFMAALVSLCQGTQRQHYRTVAVFLFTAGELASNSMTSCQSPIVKWSKIICHVILNTVLLFTNLADLLLATSAM